LTYDYSEIEYHLLKISKCWWGGRCWALLVLLLLLFRLRFLTWLLFC